MTAETPPAGRVPCGVAVTVVVPEEVRVTPTVAIPLARSAPESVEEESVAPLL